MYIIAVVYTCTPYIGGVQSWTTSYLTSWLNFQCPNIQGFEGMIWKIPPVPLLMRLSRQAQGVLHNVTGVGKWSYHPVLQVTEYLCSTSFVQLDTFYQLCSEPSKRAMIPTG